MKSTVTVRACLVALSLLAAAGWSRAERQEARVDAGSPERYRVTVALLHHGEKFTHEAYVDRETYRDLETATARDVERIALDARRKLAEKFGFDRTTFTEGTDLLVRPTLLEISGKDRCRNQSTTVFKRRAISAEAPQGRSASRRER